MTLDEARAEAKRRFGSNADVMERAPFRYPGNGGEVGDQAETHLVGQWNDGGVGTPASFGSRMLVLGKGFSFEEAFASVPQ